MKKWRRFYFVMNYELRVLLPNLLPVSAGMLILGRLMFILLGRSAQNREPNMLFSQMSDRSGQSIPYILAILLFLFLVGSYWRQDLHEWRGVGLVRQTKISGRLHCGARTIALAMGLLSLHAIALLGILLDYALLFRNPNPAASGTYDLWRAFVQSDYLRFLLPLERTKVLLFIPVALLVANFVQLLVLVDSVRTRPRGSLLVRLFVLGIAAFAVLILFQRVINTPETWRLIVLLISLPVLIAILDAWIAQLTERRDAG